MPGITVGTPVERFLRLLAYREEQGNPARMLTGTLRVSAAKSNSRRHREMSLLSLSSSLFLMAGYWILLDPGRTGASK